MNPLYKIEYLDREGQKTIVTDDIDRDAPGWLSQHNWERVPRPEGIETVKVQYLRGGGHVGTIGTVASPQCLSCSWAESSVEAIRALEAHLGLEPVTLPEWLAKIYLPPFRVYAARDLPCTQEEIDRVREQALRIIVEAVRRDADYRAKVEWHRAAAVKGGERDKRARRVAAAHPSTVEQIRRNLGGRRVLSAEHAMSIMAIVAPDEDPTELTRIVDTLAGDPRGITFWSPDACGHMRYDQPGTCTHHPLIIFAPRGLTRDRMPHCTDRALILRVAK